MPPATDQTIAQRYTSKTLEKKGKNKTALQQELGWPMENKRPVICLPAGMSEELGGTLLEELLPGLLSLPVEILILGKGSSHYGKVFTDLAKEHEHRLHIVQDTDEERTKMLAAADMALFCAEPTQSALEQCLTYGAVPIAPATTHLEDYNPIQETGNAFLFEKANLWNAFAAVVRAVETHKFPFDWRTIQKHCMEAAK